MRIAIVQFPGSNCERETISAVQRSGMIAVEYLWNESSDKLNQCDGYIIVGGFSYEDRSRAGIIAALDPIINVIREQSELGKPVLGICNGAQILVEAGLVPALDTYNTSVALTENKRMKEDKILGTGYYNALIHLRLSKNCKTNAFTKGLNEYIQLKIPVAHGEGRFLIPPQVAAAMQEQGLIAFQYCSEQGEIINEFPTNPNGSTLNCAAIINKAGNIMAMMPHPERTHQGDVIFQSMRHYIAQGYAKPITPHSKKPLVVERKSYIRNPMTHELLVNLVITDNQAFTVENTLNKLGIPARITRLTHWEVVCDSPEVFHQIQASGILYNDKKEYLVSNNNNSTERFLLIREKENLIGLHKVQQLRQYLKIKGLRSIRQGILWRITAKSEVVNTVVEDIIQTGILFNPISQVCYDYE